MTSQFFGAQLFAALGYQATGVQTWTSHGEASDAAPAWAEGHSDAYDGGGISPDHIVDWMGWPTPGWEKTTNGLVRGSYRIEYYGGGQFRRIRVEGTPDHPVHRQVGEPSTDVRTLL